MIYLETARQAKEGQMGRMSLLGALCHSKHLGLVPGTMFSGAEARLSPLAHPQLILCPRVILSTILHLSHPKHITKL